MEKSVGLDKFLEMDMLEFLDNHKKSSGREDDSLAYYEEVHEALLDKDVPRALDILEHAVEDYNKLGIQDLYKDIAYNKLLEAIQLLESYTGKGSDEVKEFLELVDEEKIRDGKPAKIMVFEDRQKARARKAFEEKEREYERKEDIKLEMRKTMQELFINIRKKNFEASVDSYKKLKQQFSEFPSNYIDEKKELYNDLLSYYIQIQKLKKELKQSRTVSVPSNNDVEAADKGKYLNPRVINGIIEGIRNDVKDKKFDSAREKVIELKHITSSIPEDYKHARALLESKISSINQKVDLAKRRWEHSQQA